MSKTPRPAPVPLSARLGRKGKFHRINVDACDAAKYVALCGRDAYASICRDSVDGDVGCEDCLRIEARTGRAA